MAQREPGLEARLADKGLPRRDFLKWCAFMTATLALPLHYTGRVARALGATTRLPVIWLEFQDCTADSESFLRASDPTTATILLEMISLNYHETLMTPAGTAAEKSRNDTLAQYPGQYLAIVEGAIPTAAGGAYCTIGGRSALDIVRQVCAGAAATLAVGTCAWDGGLPRAVPNPTAATDVRSAVPGLQNFVALPGCPANVVNIVATLVHYLTFQELPPRDESGRPLFAYGEEIHDHCERHEHYEREEFVRAWGDQGHRLGWCLYEMGCRGPETDSNCPDVKWNDATSWPIGAGHGCIGCVERGFWDLLPSFYTPVPD